MGLFIAYLKCTFKRASCILSDSPFLRVPSVANPGFLLVSLHPAHTFGMSPFVYEQCLNYSDMSVPSVFPQDPDIVIIPLTFPLSRLFPLICYLFQKIFLKYSMEDNPMRLKGVPYSLENRWYKGGNIDILALRLNEPDLDPVSLYLSLAFPESRVSDKSLIFERDLENQGEWNRDGEEAMWRSTNEWTMQDVWCLILPRPSEVAHECDSDHLFRSSKEEAFINGPCPSAAAFSS